MTFQRAQSCFKTYWEHCSNVLLKTSINSIYFLKVIQIRDILQKTISNVIKCLTLFSNGHFTQLHRSFSFAYDLVSLSPISSLRMAPISSFLNHPSLSQCLKYLNGLHEVTLCLESPEMKRWATAGVVTETPHRQPWSF